MQQSHRQRVFQIEAESGLDLLASLLNPSLSSPTNQVTTSGTTVGIREIDMILERYGGLEPGDMLDFLGGPCAGKSTAIYAIIIANVLPKVWKHSQGQPPLSFDGKSKSVLIMDLDRGFSADRLKSLLCAHVLNKLDWQHKSEGHHHPSQYMPAGQCPMVDTRSREFLAKLDLLATSCLQRVHVFRPQSVAIAIVMLRSMDRYLSQVTPVATPASGPFFSLLILDSLSSFYFQEKAQSNHTRAMTQLVDALNRLVRRWKLLFITTSWSIPSNSLSAQDRATTDALLARMKFRFSLQPRNLDRFPSERQLIQEWMSRRGPSFINDKIQDGFFTLFQGQMLIPSAQTKELFRMSISDKEGVLFHCPPFPS
ncbi:hypothetical protein BG004_001342 [Podila humilis]|nr:hypothetical protein BG004_001342 [Podila humilis]